MDDGTYNQANKALGIRSASISRLLMISFIIVALLPVGILTVKLYSVAWDNAWREITEKHQLLAKNLAAPLAIYVNDHRHSLELLSDFVTDIISSDLSNQQLQVKKMRLLKRAMARLQSFRTVSLVDRDGNITVSTTSVTLENDRLAVYKNDACYLSTRSTGQWSLSGIKASRFTREPTIIMSQAIRDQAGKISHVLIGELRIDLIEKLRKKIKFGILGHSAIVDQFGHVIAHPNPNWMKEMRDISKIPIVKAMMAGKTGVTEFYSPFLKTMMVAGYASVPKIGWGIMVPQPKPEVEAHVNRLLFTQMAWGGFGLILAIMLAFILMRWITRPLNQLCDYATDLTAKGFKGELSNVSNNAPAEIRHLSDAMSNLVNGLQLSRSEYEKLNISLQARVVDATSELQKANDSLRRQASQDYLTCIANRRHFEEILAKSITQKRQGDDCLCLMLIDVDHFKPINDQYGHAAGDTVLVQLAELLDLNTRKEDLVARYAGDEFVILIRCSRAHSKQQANKLLLSIQQHPFTWAGANLNITVSIGLLCQQKCIELTMDVLLETVDRALYQAKDNGRNQVHMVSL